MRSLESYLSEYAESHQHPLNVKIHNICVPAIAWSLLGFLHSFKIHDTWSAAQVFTVLALLYYAAFKKWALWLAMLVAVIVTFVSFNFIPHLRLVSVAVFVIAWIGQFYGHHVEGKKPSFLKDLLFLLIGPLWVMQKGARYFFETRGIKRNL